MLDLLRIKAIGLDLDDTLWPIWPAISRAEAQMVAWLAQRAPASAAVFADPVQRQSLRDAVVQSRPDLGHDMSALRRAAVREALLRNGEDTALAEPAFDVFFEHRMRVELYADALPALVFLASRYPVIAVSNGNADVGRIGIGAHFKGDVSAHLLGGAGRGCCAARSAARGGRSGARRARRPGRRDADGVGQPGRARLVP